MLSKRTAGWKLHDWLAAVFLFVFFLSLIVIGVHGLAPNSGLGTALHNAGQAVGHILQLIAGFLNLVASWFLQL